MNQFFIRWFINIIALVVVVHVIAGVNIDNWGTTIVAGLVLGLFNAFLKPFIITLTLPFNILSLGFLTLIINGMIFYLAARFVTGFEVVSFWSAFWAALLFSIISFILNIFFTPGIHGTTVNVNNRTRQTRHDDVIDVDATEE